MPTLTSCPSCSKQLKVPDELIGRQVKCPSCGTTFTASASGPPPSAASPTPAAPRYDPAPGDTARNYDAGFEDEARPRRPAGSNPLFGPGIAMLISSILNVLFGGYLIVNGFYVMNNPAAALEFNPMVKKDMNPQEKEQLEATMKVAGPGYAVAGVIGILCGFLTLLGAIQMMRGKGGGLPWTASVLSVIPCTAPCCCTGIPIGIWGMMALNKVGKG